MISIGFHARYTNPLSMGYFAYLACFDSWRKVVDRVVAVDGGSRDVSNTTLLDWVEHDSQVDILNTADSHWGDNFAWEQSTLNMQLGQAALDECDWIIRADADHVVDVRTAAGLRRELETTYADQLVVAFDVFFFRNGRYHRRATARNWIINNRLAQKRGIRIGWGEDLNKGLLSDDPLIVERESTFVDPETQRVKPLMHGRPLPLGPVCSTRAYRYGHFFFTRQQALAKCQIWDEAVVKYKNCRPKTRLQLQLDADVLGIEKFMPLDVLQAIDHPPDLQRLLATHYRPDMLGAALYLPYAERGLKILRYCARAISKIRRLT